MPRVPSASRLPMAPEMSSALFFVVFISRYLPASGGAVGGPHRGPGHRTVRESLLHLDVHHGDILPAGVGLRKMSGGFGIHRRLADQRPEVPGAGVKLAAEHAF